MRSTMFLQNVTQIDCAAIAPGNEKLQGGSVNVSVDVEGEIDTQESVVVDFGTVKKDIKRIIDSDADGYDHKLLVRPGDVKTVSNCEQAIIQKDSYEITCPMNAIKVVDYTDTHYFAGLDSLIESKLNAMYPKSNIKVRTSLSQNTKRFFTHYGDDGFEVKNFCYIHGLKDSSSYGCQNMNHGHRSWIALFDNKERRCISIDEEVMDSISEAIFINKANIVNHNSKWITIAYGVYRGMFISKYHTDAYNIQVLNTETTIENLVDWVYRKHFDIWKNYPGCTIYMSEGMSKGALRHIK